jgi:hypothetical protein
MSELCLQKPRPDEALKAYPFIDLRPQPRHARRRPEFRTTPPSQSRGGQRTSASSPRRALGEPKHRIGTRYERAKRGSARIPPPPQSDGRPCRSSPEAERDTDMPPGPMSRHTRRRVNPRGILRHAAQEIPRRTPQRTGHRDEIPWPGSGRQRHQQGPPCPNTSDRKRRSARAPPRNQTPRAVRAAASLRNPPLCPRKKPRARGVKPT